MGLDLGLWKMWPYNSGTKQIVPLNGESFFYGWRGEFFFVLILEGEIICPK